jgi:hypothetical protein
MVNEEALRYYGQRGVEEGGYKWDAFQRFAETELKPILDNTIFSLYEIELAVQ